MRRISFFSRLLHGLTPFLLVALAAGIARSQTAPHRPTPLGPVAPIVEAQDPGNAPAPGPTFIEPLSEWPVSNTTSPEETLATGEATGDEPNSPATVSEPGASEQPATGEEGGFRSLSDQPTDDNPLAEQVQVTRFNGVEPGQTTAAELRSVWGEPIGMENRLGESILRYENPPFREVAIVMVDGLVDSITVYLRAPSSPDQVAQEIGMSDFRPALVPDAQGQILGQVYPERGVLFVFSPDEQEPMVSQIIIEPIRAESFVMRARHDFSHAYRESLADLTYALSLDSAYGEAWWLKAQLLAARGRWEEAALCASSAVQAEANNAQYLLTQAMLFNETGRYPQALEITQQLLANEQLSPIDRAQAEHQLGNLLAEGPQPDFTQALAHQQQAIALTAPLASSDQFDLRRRAKQILVVAHQGVAMNISAGVFQQQGEIVPQWLDRADALIDNLVEHDRGDPLLRLQAIERRLAAAANLPAYFDPTQIVLEGETLAAQLKNRVADPWFDQQVDRLLGRALYYAVLTEKGRGQFGNAMQYADRAVNLLEAARQREELGERDEFYLGQIFFLAGSVQAIQQEDHTTAVQLYEYALERLSGPTPLFALSKAGNHGEWFVSMGVSFWQTGHHQRAMQLTRQGADLMKRAVDEGVLDPTVLSVPYSNLAAMHRHLGQEGQANTLTELAERYQGSSAEEPTRR